MNTGQNPKGYNNPKSWEGIENNNTKTIIVDTETDIESNMENDVVEDIEVVETEDDDILEISETEENFDEVLQLTQYEGGGLSTRNENTDFVVAEYEKIDTINISKLSQKSAKNFVSKIVKFVLEFNDVQLTEDHKNYIRQVGNLQLNNLSDMLELVAINKQMIANIVARVNATQAEDYAIINSYNNLLNQHIKLIKEVATMYKSIPSVIKKMRADVLTNQELENNSDTNDEVVTEDYGETQFNNGKQMLKSILAKKQQQQQNLEE